MLRVVLADWGFPQIKCYLRNSITHSDTGTHGQLTLPPLKSALLSLTPDGQTLPSAVAEATLMLLLQKLGLNPPRWTVGDTAKNLQILRLQQVSASAHGPTTHLPIHGPDDGGLDSHAADEADVEILVQHEGLEAGTDEQ